MSRGGDEREFQNRCVLLKLDPVWDVRSDPLYDYFKRCLMPRRGRLWLLTFCYPELSPSVVRFLSSATSQSYIYTLIATPTFTSQGLISNCVV